MRRLLFLLAMCLLGPGFAARAGSRIYTVDCKGGGDFRSVQECFDALPSKPAEWRTVVIRPGTYREKLTLDVYKDKVHIVAGGNGAGGACGEVRIVWGDHTGKVVEGHEMTTYDTWTFSIQADDVWVEGITVENDAPPGAGQAVALETRGDRICLCDCRLLGNQDTFFTRGYVSRIHVRNCYVEGTTDFIFGPSIVLFEDCTIHCKADSFITAASTTERNKYGYVFVRCRVTAAEGVAKVYLGRPWKSTARTVWIECELPAAIRSEGWRDWHDSAAKGAVYYAEWRCTGPGADRSGRVPWSYALTDEERKEYESENIFAKKTGSEQFYDDWSGHF